jgi:MFS family permease
MVVVRTVSGWLPWLNWWRWPFLWIILIPGVTIPWQIVLLGNSGRWPAARVYDNCELEPDIRGATNTWECSPEHVLPTLLPGLLILVALLWLFSSVRRTRLAAVVAGGLAVARLITPALIYVASGTVTLRTTFFPGPDASVAASVALWMVSIAVAFAFPRLFKEDGRSPAGVAS